jgi:hypothetical protein
MVPSVATEKFPSVTPQGIDPETVRLEAECLNHNATPGPLSDVSSGQKIACAVRGLNFIKFKIEAEKFNFVVKSRNWHAERDHGMIVHNSSFERVEQFKYFGTTLTNQNSIQEEIKEQIEVRECLL